MISMLSRADDAPFLILSIFCAFISFILPMAIYLFTTSIMLAYELLRLTTMTGKSALSHMSIRLSLKRSVRPVGTTISPAAL